MHSTLTIARGEFRTFGPLGPAYEVLEVDAQRNTAHVQVLPTGERLDYPIDQVLQDPEAD